MGFTFDKAGRVHSLKFILMVFGYFNDIFIYDYDISVWELIGAIVIVACSCAMFMMKFYNYSK
jgi:Ca2+/Na+ antiporter